MEVTFDRNCERIDCSDSYTFLWFITYRCSELRKRVKWFYRFFLRIANVLRIAEVIYVPRNCRNIEYFYQLYHQRFYHPVATTFHAHRVQIRAHMSKRVYISFSMEWRDRILDYRYTVYALSYLQFPTVNRIDGFGRFTPAITTSWSLVNDPRSIFPPLSQWLLTKNICQRAKNWLYHEKQQNRCLWIVQMKKEKTQRSLLSPGSVVFVILRLTISPPNV